MIHYEKGIEFGIKPRWDKKVNVVSNEVHVFGY